MTYRNRPLLDVAHDAPCMFQIEGVCQSGVHPSVPCHSNEQRHGRGFAHKSADAYAPAGCIACHAWYDTGPAPREEKQSAFRWALERWWLWLLQNERLVVA